MTIHLPKVMRKWFATEVGWSGWDGLLERLEELCGFGLYSVSKEWVTGPYILKAKGARGDLLVIFDA